MMGKEDHEENSKPFETKSTGQSSPMTMELAASSGPSPEQVDEILDEA